MFVILNFFTRCSTISNFGRDKGKTWNITTVYHSNNLDIFNILKTYFKNLSLLSLSVLFLSMMLGRLVLPLFLFLPFPFPPFSQGLALFLGMMSWTKSKNKRLLCPCLCQNIVNPDKVSRYLHILDNLKAITNITKTILDLISRFQVQVSIEVS